MRKGYQQTGRGRAAALLAFAVLLLGLSASAASAAGSRSYDNCAGAVISDWYQHDPNVVGHYPIPCYQQALKQLGSYQDIKAYSNALENIKQAEQLEILYQKQHPGAASTTGGGNNSSSGGGPGPSSGGGGGGHGPSSGGGKGLITRVIDSVGPGNAQSVPLPLIVLGGLAVLLLLAALGTWIAKRVQARRLQPAPARARSSRS